MIPYAAQIIQLLTPLWSPTTEPLLQSSLVVTFTKITSVSLVPVVLFMQNNQKLKFMHFFPCDRFLMNNPINYMKFLYLLSDIVLIIIM